MRRNFRTTCAMLRNYCTQSAVQFFRVHILKSSPTNAVRQCRKLTVITTNAMDLKRHRQHYRSLLSTVDIRRWNIDRPDKSFSVQKCVSVFCVQPTSVSTDPEYNKLDVFSERLHCSRVSEPVTSLGDVASTDTESSDTATESPGWCRRS